MAKRRQFTAEFKTRVVLELLKEEKQLGELAAEYELSPMPPTTEQAVIMLSSHFYESRDGSTAGFFGDSVQAGQQVWNTVNLLLRLDRDWKV
jgi:hypothetical protein